MENCLSKIENGEKVQTQLMSTGLGQNPLSLCICKTCQDISNA